MATDLLVADERSRPQLLPALDVLPLQNLSPHAEILEQRAIGLWRLSGQKFPITILPVASALLKIEPADHYRQLALRMRVGEEDEGCRRRLSPVRGGSAGAGPRSSSRVACR